MQEVLECFRKLNIDMIYNDIGPADIKIHRCMNIGAKTKQEKISLVICVVQVFV